MRARYRAENASFVRSFIGAVQHIGFAGSTAAIDPPGEPTIAGAIVQFGKKMFRDVSRLFLTRETYFPSRLHVSRSLRIQKVLAANFFSLRDAASA